MEVVEEQLVLLGRPSKLANRHSNHNKRLEIQVFKLNQASRYHKVVEGLANLGLRAEICCKEIVNSFTSHPIYKQ